MLIEFKVENFRSIREEQTLSFIANKADKQLPDCIIEKELKGLSGTKFLKGAAIYGPNASGKSNILLALLFLKTFIKKSAKDIEPSEVTGTEYFKLDKLSRLKPSKFTITFVVADVRYIFCVAMTTERVMEEYLIAYPNGGAGQRWYWRHYDSESKKYEWKMSSYFKYDKSVQEKTRENALFLSVAAHWNNEQLTPIFLWFMKNLRLVSLSVGHGLDHAFTAKKLNDPNYRDRIVEFIKSADFGVVSAESKEKEISVEDLKANLPTSVIADFEAKGVLKAQKHFEINLLHKGEDGLIPLDFEDEESAGTRRFFSLLGPWFDILDNGYTVFIDEIEASLHTNLVRELIKTLLCGKRNTKGAQIIFTTHHPVLLDLELMRRDQIWFTEKDQRGATHLYPLTDFQPRKDEALVRGYLAGRYGAIPFLSDGLKL